MRVPLLCKANELHLLLSILLEMAAHNTSCKDPGVGISRVGFLLCRKIVSVIEPHCKQFSVQGDGFTTEES